MAIVVIDELEFIQIKVEHGEPKPIATGSAEGGLDAIPEQSPIGQIGKLIEERHMLQVIQQLFPLNGGSAPMVPRCDFRGTPSQLDEVSASPRSSLISFGKSSSVLPVRMTSTQWAVESIIEGDT